MYGTIPTLTFANSLENGRILFVELFSVKSKEALEWCAIFRREYKFLSEEGQGSPQPQFIIRA